MIAKEEGQSALTTPIAQQSDKTGGGAPYRSTPVFDQDTLPSALRNRHATKAGVWGLICVIEGQLLLTYLEPPSEVLLDAAQAAVVLPQQPHFVTPQGRMKMQVDFYDHQPG